MLGLAFSRQSKAFLGSLVGLLLGHWTSALICRSLVEGKRVILEIQAVVWKGD